MTLETSIVILLEGGDHLQLYYPYVMDGEENLVLLEEYARDNWMEDSQARYQQGMDIINNKVPGRF